MQIKGYQCPVCYIHKQRYGAKSREALQTHLEYSHIQTDLARYIVKQITGAVR